MYDKQIMSGTVLTEKGSLNYIVNQSLMVLLEVMDLNTILKGLSVQVI
jgi:hypothetical protein